MKSLKNLIFLIITYRISNYTVWFAPFIIALAIYLFLKGESDLGFGALLGGLLLILAYFIKYYNEKRKNNR